MIGHSTLAQKTALTSGRIEFILTSVRGSSSAEISERMGKVAELATEHGAAVHDLISSLVIVAYGTHPAPGTGPGTRSTFVEALRRELADDIKIVHGTGVADYGSLGSSIRMSWSFILPEFEDSLATLCRLEFGQVQEFGA